MTQLEIELLLIKVVCELQELSGREMVAVTADTTPIEDLPGFDSLNGVEATIEILEQLKLPLEFNNVFMQNEKVLSIKDAAARLNTQALKIAK